MLPPLLLEMEYPAELTYDWRAMKNTAIHSLVFGLIAALSLPAASLAQQRYEQEYPTIDYAEAPLNDPASRLFDSGGAAKLSYREGRGYLDSLLEALEIDPSSQVLVFSKTSLKQRLITPQTPRALYFNDDVYVGFVQGSRSLEVAAMDPNLGPVFFELTQEKEVTPHLEREVSRCMRCHDSYSMSGDGTPRFMLSSVLAGTDGSIVSHEINHITTTAVPLYERWGGWYVTGFSGDQRHMANLAIETGRDFQRRDEGSNANLDSLEGLVDTRPYLAPTSDIVALLVMEHQVQVQNRIARSHYKVKTALDKQGYNADTQNIIAFHGEDLLFDLLGVGETMLEDEIEGVSGFREYFEGLGPFDSQGRSLRELDLETRTFRHPLSYQIYSDAFAALPVELKEYVFRRLQLVLEGIESIDGLSASRRELATARDILLETHEEYREWSSQHPL